jgi:hypothetical protein
MYDLDLAAGDDRFSDRRLDNIIDWPKGGPTDRAAILHTRRKPSTDPADPTARLCVARDDQPFDCSTVKFPQDSVETTGSEPISTCPIEQLIDGALFVARQFAEKVIAEIVRGAAHSTPRMWIGASVVFRFSSAV